MTRALVGQGDLLRLPYPSYILYRTLAEIQGARVRAGPFCADWGLTADFARAAPRLKLVFLPNPNSPSGTVISREQILELAERLPCPLLVDEAYVDFADTNCLDLVAQNPKIMVSRSAEQVVRAGRPAVRFPGGPTAADRGVGQGQGLLQLRCAVDRRSDGGHRRSGLAHREPSPASWPRGSGWSRRCGSSVLPSCPPRRTSSGVPIRQQPLQPVYEKLKASHVLVRYMNYPEWGEGLRISVGTDEQVDACWTLLKAILERWRARRELNAARRKPRFS